MIRIKQRIIKIEMWGCDFCGYETDNNSAVCGIAPILKCDFCGKMVCKNHRHIIYHCDSEIPCCVSCVDCKSNL